MNDSVRAKVETPGLALISVGFGSCFAGLLCMAFGLFDGFVNGVGINSIVRWGSVGLSQLVAGGVIAFGGFGLRGASGGPWVWTAAVVALVPCCTWGCCCLTAPAGIWAIYAMMDDGVKEAFALNA